MTLPKKAASALLLQLTDSHLFAAPDGRLWGLPTDESLRLVVDMARRDLARRGSKADLLLASGDLAQDGSIPAYRRFQAMTEGLAEQTVWTAGNHDDPDSIRAVGRDHLSGSVDCGAWRVILLDSRLPGEVFGGLNGADLAQLKEWLDDAHDRPVLIVLHHPPFAVGSPNMDRIGLRNPQPFWRLLDAHPQVRGVLCGHVHQDYDGYRGPIRLLTSPATSVQFAVGAETFSLSREAPGYRWLCLNADGSLDTGVSRLTHFDFEPVL